jgi:hypothetical protein
MNKRPSIPINIERQVLIEAGHRCAIPTCKYTRVEIAHIVPWAESNDNSFENLIALCPNCHDLYDKDRRIDRKSMLIYKKNLGLLNHRYGEFERRILHHFCETGGINVCLPGLSEIQVLYLLKDKLLTKSGTKSGTSATSHGLTVHTWEEYILTDEGKRFVDNLRQARSLE